MSLFGNSISIGGGRMIVVDRDSVSVKANMFMTEQRFPRSAISAIAMPERGQLVLLGHGGAILGTINVPSLQSSQLLGQLQRKLGLH